jgi:hypothetical protein
MRNVALIVGVGLVALLVSLFDVFPPLDRANAGRNDVTIDVAIDVDTEGNDDNFLGQTESCNDTPLQVGETIDVDIVVRGVPEFQEDVLGTGIRGSDFELRFNPGVVSVKEIHAFDGPTILKTGGPPEPIVFINYFHGDTFGFVTVGVIDLSAGRHSGDGILTRATLEAVGTGATRLDLTYDLAETDRPNLYAQDESTSAYTVNESNATIVVGDGSCAAPTPTTYPATPPSPTPFRSRTPSPIPSPSPTRSPTPTAAATPTIAATATATATLAPTSTATVTPASLPPTGGSPGSEALWPAAVGALVVAAAVLGALVVARRRV